MAQTSRWTGSSGFLQVIRIEWTKASRGAEGSRARNAVPSGAPIRLEEFTGERASLSVEVQDWTERNSFVEPIRVDRKSVSLAEGFTWGGLSIALRDREPCGLRVQYMRGFSSGAPERWFLNSGSGTEGPGAYPLALGDGESVRIADNGRFSDNDGGHWWYRQLTINAAWFDRIPDTRVFVDRKPTYNLRTLARLR